MSGLFGGGKQTIATSETPLAGFNIQSSVFGKPVPLLFGRNRIAGNLIWYGDFAAIPHTTSSSTSGGKGGGGITTSNTTYTYQTSFLLGLAEGPVSAINNCWVDKEYHAGASAFTKFLGSYSQTAWSYLSSAHPTEALAYRGTAYVAAAGYDLGGSVVLGNHSFDITGLLPYDPGTIDGANPREIIAALLTGTHYGAGFPSAYLGDWGQFSAYCIANDLFMSPAYETQQEARQAITDLIQLANSGIFFSEGLLKIAPFSDSAATAHGVTFTPVVDPSYELDDDDYLDHDQPVRVMRTPNADAYNQVQIEYLDSASQYNIAIANAQDQASVELYGLRQMDIIVAHQITDAATARLVAQLILQRAMYTRNVYEFKVGWRYARLEPCDYVTLTDVRLGLDRVPVRVLSVEEDDTGALTINAEDAPAGIHSSPLYTAPAGDGYVVDYSVAPGNVVAPAFFEIPATQALSGLAVGIAVTGNSVEWGGCEIWGSNDGTSYAYVGQTAGGARYGTIGSAITAAVGQVPRITLAGIGGQILSGSAADAANLSTLALIGPEFVAFTTSALVAANVYDLTLATRGVHNTTAAAHSGGAPFVRVDDAVAYSDDLDLSMIGKTLYFKFLSYNRYGGGRQALADVSAYSYTVTGAMAQLAPPTASGVTLNTSANCIFVTWTNPANMSQVDRTEILRGTTSSVGSATVIDSVRGSIGFYADYVGSGGPSYYYWIRQINQQGFPSTAIGGSSATAGVVSATPGAGSIVNSMLTADCVLAANIKAGEITASHLAAGTITANKIASNTITATQIANGTITSTQIAGGTITAAEIASNTITAAKIASGTITATEMAAAAITAGKIAANAITAAGGEIASLAVTTLKIDDNAVTVPVGAYTSGEVTGSAASGGAAVWTTAQSVTITVDGSEPVFVLASCGLNSGNTVAYPRVRIRRGSTTIFGTLDSSDISSATGVLFHASPIANTFFGGSWGVVDSPGAGTYTYYLQFATHNGSIAPKANLRSMSAATLKK